MMEWKTRNGLKAVVDQEVKLSDGKVLYVGWVEYAERGKVYTLWSETTNLYEINYNLVERRRGPEQKW
jgi:hypothetical protein